MEYRSREVLDLARERIAVLNSSITNAKRNNATRQTALDKRAVYQQRLRDLSSYEDSINRYYKGAMIRVEQFRDECNRNLETRIESILALILPDEQFHIKLTFKPYRGSYVSEIYTGKEKPNGDIVWGKPRSQNGDFIKQLISFSMVCSLNLLLGSDFLLMDEPFNSADVTNVGKIQPVFDMMLEDGLQILMIEHKEELYRSVDRNQIDLLKHRHPTDEHKGYAEVIKQGRCEAEYGYDVKDTNGGPEGSN